MDFNKYNKEGIDTGHINMQ